MTCPTIFPLTHSELNPRIGLAIYPPMAFGISIIAFTLQLVREKDPADPTLPPPSGHGSWTWWIRARMSEER